MSTRAISSSSTALAGSPAHSMVFDNSVGGNASLAGPAAQSGAQPAPQPASTAASGGAGGAALRAVWKKDEAVHACERCSRQFTFYRRRHHCRRCGGIYCAECSNEKQAGISGWTSAERVCLICRSMAPATTLAAQPRERHVVILGSPGVGKSTIAQLFASTGESASGAVTRGAPSPGASNSTRRLFRHKSGIEFAVVLEDTIGQSQVGAFPPALAIAAHAYVLVFSVDDRSSLYALRAIHERILDCGGHFQPVLVVGTIRGEARVVPSDEGEKAAAEMRARYAETTLTYGDVTTLFDKVLEEIVARE